MKSYLNDSALKKNTIAAMKADIKAELLVKGHYWNGTNGCFVGCVIRGQSHADFEIKLGIPRILARLADRIFEGLEYAESKKFAVSFLQSIPVGVDLSGVWDKFAYFMLVDEKHGVINFTKNERSKKSIQDVADMYQRKINGEKIDANVWLELRRNADAAAAAAYAYADAVDAAADAAAAYADAAADADAYAYAYADAAYAAAAAAAYAAADAVDAYAYADAAAYAAADAAAADAAAAARSRHYMALATALLKFLCEAGKV